MIIVIEGCDGTGKTTLAEAFAARGFDYTHTVQPKPGEDLFVSYTRQLLAAKDRDVVFDRLHVGELVYGEVMRGVARLNVPQLRLLNRLLFGRGGIVVFCVAPLEQVQAAWRARRDREYVPDMEKLYKVYAAYDQLRMAQFEDMGAPHVTYDLTQWRSQGNVRRFVAMFLMAQRQIPSCPEGVIGSPTARYLLIGEQVNAPHHEPDLAFYADSGSSHFLNTALWEAGYAEHQLAFTNARDADGRTRALNKLVDSLSPGIRVIALGRVAQRTCLAQGVPFLPAAHPQHVKRFHSPRRSSYVALLRSFR